MRKTIALLQSQDVDNDEDLFADIEVDEDELENNEIAIEDS